MRSIIITSVSILFILPVFAQINFGKLKKQAEETVNTVTSGGGTSSLTNDQIIQGLKEALTVGTNNASGLASKVDGFNKNPKIKIPFPPEAKDVKSTVEKFGMKPQVDKFVTTLNRAAEEAAKDAAPIFVNAVKTMNINDGLNILNGGDRAATDFLQHKTTEDLKTKFQPIVRKAINKVQLTKYWKPLASKYNKVPFVKKINPDLEAYVTEKAILGLFTLIAEEETKIRKDPSARVTDILETVFGPQ